MTPIKYGKLVRDRVPEIIEEDGWIPRWETLEEEALSTALDAKLIEEVGEYHSNLVRGGDGIAELVDIFEIVVTLAERANTSLQQLIGMSNMKREERGGFKDGIWLIETSVPQQEETR